MANKKRQIRKVAVRQTKRGAEEEERRIRNAIADGSYWTQKYGSSTDTLDSFCDEYLNLHCKTQLAPSTTRAYTSIIENHIRPKMGSILLSNVTEKDIITLQASLDSQSAKTVRNILGCLQGMLRVAKRWGYIETIPDFELPKVQKKAPKFLTLDEVARLKDSATTYPLDWFVTLGLNTGMRFSELVALHWHDIDDTTNTITVRRAYVEYEIKTPKSGHERQIPITKALRDALPERTDGFVAMKDGGLYSYTMVQLGYEAAQEAAGIPREKWGWHTLRHTYASHLAMQGVPIQSISKLLGHSDVRITMRYAHLSPSALADHVSKIDGLF